MNDQDKQYHYGQLIGLVLGNNVNELRDELSRGADPNVTDSDSRTALIHAAIAGSTELVILLLDAAAETDVRDYLGFTALHYAAQNYHPSIVSLLLGHGATTEIEDMYGNTPLWRAAFNSRGRGEVIKILLKAGGDKDHKNKHGSSPLDVAQGIANYNIMQFFE